MIISLYIRNKKVVITRIFLFVNRFASYKYFFQLSKIFLPRHINYIANCSVLNAWTSLQHTSICSKYQKYFFQVLQLLPPPLPPIDWLQTAGASCSSYSYTFPHNPIISFNLFLQTNNLCLRFKQYFFPFWSHRFLTFQNKLCACI